MGDLTFFQGLVLGVTIGLVNLACLKYIWFR